VLGASLDQTVGLVLVHRLELGLKYPSLGHNCHELDWLTLHLDAVHAALGLLLVCRRPRQRGVREDNLAARHEIQTNRARVGNQHDAFGALEKIEARALASDNRGRFAVDAKD
jgi:hypothetical protein